jgi:plasmid segregation protein ParM
MRGIGPMLVGLDDGYDHTKVCTVERSDRFATAVSTTRKRTARVLAHDGPEDLAYLIGNEEFTVGAHVQTPLDTRSDDYPYSAASLAVAMEAIRRVAPATVKVHVVTGLPLNRFFDPNGRLNQDKVDRKARGWCRPIKTIQGVALPQITQVTVIAQAVAAWFDFIIDDNMREKEDVMNDHMAVVDIGGRTTDLAVFNMTDLNMRTSGTLDYGMLNVSDEVVRFIEDRHPGVSPSRDMVVKAMQQRIAHVGANSYDVTGQIGDGKRILADRIAEFVRRRLGGDIHHLKRILFVGGGSSELKAEILQRFSSACFPSGDPQMSNVKGMLKYGFAVQGTESAPDAA